MLNKQDIKYLATKIVNSVKDETCDIDAIENVAEILEKVLNKEENLLN